MSVEDIQKYKILLETVLEEAQNYEDMFNDLRQAAVAVPQQPNYLDNQIRDIIARCKQKLKKKDRIVWFLRQWKIGFAFNMIFTSIFGQGPEIDKDSDYIKYIHRIMNDLQKRANNSEMHVGEMWELYKKSDRVLTSFEHYFSLPIPAIQDFKFAYQFYRDVSDQFQKLEDDWKEKTRQLIPYAPSDGTVLLKFADGFFWVALNREYCRAEGNAMGHCGNTAASQDGDNVLSLRQQVRVGKDDYVRPCLTFILHNDGTLGEMKGRANNKPDKKYHSYIVALLQLPMIKGIEGGGHAPQNNFSMSDLDPVSREALVRDKPALGSLMDYYEENGFDDYVEHILEKDFSLVFDHSGSAVVETVRNVSYLIRAYGTPEAEQLVMYLTGADKWESGVSDRDAAEQALESFPDDLVRSIGRYIIFNNKKQVAEWERFESKRFNPESYKNVFSIVYKYRNDELKNLFVAIGDSIRMAEEAGVQQNIRDFLGEQITTAIRKGTGGMPVKMKFDNEDNVFSMEDHLEVIVDVEHLIQAHSNDGLREHIKSVGWLENYQFDCGDFDYSGFDMDAGVEFLYDEIPALETIDFKFEEK